MIAPFINYKLITKVTKPQRVEDRFRALYELHEGSALNGNNASLSKIRRDAIEKFAKTGFPHRKTEAWKYTPIAKFIPQEARVQLDAPSLGLTEQDLASYIIPDLDAYRVVMLNGRLVKSLSQTEGLSSKVTLMSLRRAAEEHAATLDTYFAKQADYKQEAFVALNTAFVRSGLYLHIPKGISIDKPIHVIHLMHSDGTALIQPRMLYIAEAHTTATVIETFHSHNDVSAFVNTVTEWAVRDQARIDHYQVQDFNDSTTVVSTIEAHQAHQSYFSTHTSTLGGAVIRNTLHIVPDAEECESHLFGLVHGTDKMHVDNHTLVDHRKPNCFSNELYKNILNDKATGIFNGKVFVRQDAQKINAYQSNKSITLTEQAKMYSKPELEIYADDVKCSHGATTGQLDADALFYLRSRGLNDKQARTLLLMAFARDVIDLIKVDALREHLDQRIAAAL